jgi:CheY-like chemotaxis protein
LLEPANHAPPLVLVIDDDAEIRAMLTRAIALEGYAVATAANGSEALALLQRGLRPAVIFLDLTMPVMDGWQFMAARTLEPTAAGIPILLISGDENLADKAARAGVAGYLSKPLMIDDLHEALTRCRGQRQL